MDALNTLRAALVGLTFIATLLLAARGQWAPTIVLSLGIVAHLALFFHQRAQRRRTDQQLTAMTGYPPVEG